MIVARDAMKKLSLERILYLQQISDTADSEFRCGLRAIDCI